MREYRFLGELGDKIELIARNVTQELVERRLAEEEDVSAALVHEINVRLTDEIYHQFNDASGKKVRFRAKKYSRSGPNSEQTRTGADIGGLLEIDFPTYQIKKAYLAQAKICKIRNSHGHVRDWQFNSPNVRDLREQCEKMLKITSESFLFLYTNNIQSSILVVPASTLLALDRVNSDFANRLYKREFRYFYNDFVQSFLGDRALGQINDVDALLESAVVQNYVNHAVYIRVEPKDGGEQRRKVPSPRIHSKLFFEKYYRSERIRTINVNATPTVTPEKTIYILGAGASAGYDKSLISGRAPTARDFLQKAVKIHEEHFASIDFDLVYDFIQQYWGLNREQLKQQELNIEDVLTLLEIEIKINHDNEFFVDAKEQLIRLICITLEKILYGEPCPYHSAITRALRQNDTIISFNWDILIDNCLLDINWHTDDGYGFTFNKIFRDNVWHATRQDIHSTNKLLKLHGSLNWMKCSNCSGLFCYHGEKAAAQEILYPKDQRYFCPNCHDCRLERMIIPPTLEKSIQVEPFVKIWELALQEIASAERIVIIGYSLPNTDYISNWLFRRAKQINNQRLQIEIIDINSAALIEKFKSIFRPAAIITDFATIGGFARSLISQ